MNMDSKPILFSAPMVQAILDGRKSMTRRGIKPNPQYEYLNITSHDKDGVWFATNNMSQIFKRYPYQVGDVLWVRETFGYNWNKAGKPYEYLADYADKASASDLVCWSPSIFMPRAAARIFLRVTDVRVERLQDMPWEDAAKEGFGDYPNELDAFESYVILWQSLNAKRGYPWSSNPWVWVIAFERCDKKESDIL